MLKGLADLPHASLAIVYTKQRDLRNIRLQVAAYLRGYESETKSPHSERIRDVLGLDDTPVDADLVLSYFRGTVTTTDFAQKVQAACADGIESSDVIHDLVEDYLREKLHVAEVHGALPLPFGIDNSDAEGAPLWVWCNNLFVAFVNKELVESETREGERLVDELLRTILAWHPDGLTTTLAYARGSIARTGFRAAAGALANRELHAGLLYFSNAGSSEERRDRVKQFYVRLLSGFVEQVLDDVTSFGEKALIQPPQDQDLLSWACEQVTLASNDETRKSVVFELNRFMATEDPGGYVQLGTIFEAPPAADKPTQVWMVVTPACDLVPREPYKQREWEYALHPLRAAICIKAKLREPARLEKQLKVAEQNRQIFTCQTGKGDRLILEFLPNDDTPHLEHIYLNDMGRITNGQFEGWRLSHKDSTLQSQKETFRVITQVRQTYANRFLRAAGEHLSRIALSFVRYKPASGAAETSVTSTRESSGQPGQETHSRPAGEDQASVSAQIPSRPLILDCHISYVGVSQAIP